MSLAICEFVQTFGDLQREYLWTVVLNNSTSQLEAMGLSSSAAEWVNGNSGKIGFVCNTFPYPARKTAELDFQWAGEHVIYAGVDQSVKSGSFSFFKDQSNYASYFWNILKDLSGDSVQHAYKGKVTTGNLNFVLALVKTDKMTISELFSLYNVQVLGCNENINLNKQGNSIVTASGTIAWDYAAPISVTSGTNKTAVQDLVETFLKVPELKAWVKSSYLDNSYSTNSSTGAVTMTAPTSLPAYIDPKPKPKPNES